MQNAIPLTLLAFVVLERPLTSFLLKKIRLHDLKYFLLMASYAWCYSSDPTSIVVLEQPLKSFHLEKIRLNDLMYLSVNGILCLTVGLALYCQNQN